jgi:hypothetical protein
LGFEVSGSELEVQCVVFRVQGSKTEKTDPGIDTFPLRVSCLIVFITLNGVY